MTSDFWKTAVQSHVLSILLYMKKLSVYINLMKLGIYIFWLRDS